jgi:hypothetical protein
MKKLSRSIGLILSITLLAQHTDILGIEPQKGRLAHAWGATKNYAGKVVKRIGLDTATEKAKNSVTNYAKQAESALRKFIACLEGKETCSKEDIKKVRLYTAMVIAAITILTAGVGYKKWQKQKEKPAQKLSDGTITSKGASGNPEEKEAQIEKSQKKQAQLMKKLSAGTTTSRGASGNPEELAPLLKRLKSPVDWNSTDGTKITAWINDNWYPLDLRLKEHLITNLKFPASRLQKNNLTMLLPPRGAKGKEEEGEAEPTPVKREQRAQPSAQPTRHLVSETMEEEEAPPKGISPKRKREVEQKPEYTQKLSEMEAEEPGEVVTNIEKNVGEEEKMFAEEVKQLEKMVTGIEEVRKEEEERQQEKNLNLVIAATDNDLEEMNRLLTEVGQA